MKNSLRILGALLLTLGALAPLIQAADQKPVVSYTIDRSLVLVDVVALDENGRPALDLKKEDFEIREDGVEQEIAACDLALTETAAPAGEPAASRPRSLVLVVDQATTNIEQLRKSWKALEEFVKDTAKPGDRIAIFSFHSNLTLLRGFTADREALAKFIEGFKMEFKVGAQVLWPEGGPLPQSDPDSPALKFMDEPMSGAEVYDRLYNALISVSKALRPVEGRKEMILLSSGFIDEGGLSLSREQELKRNLADAQATLNVIDTAGMHFAAADGGESSRLDFQRSSALARLADAGRGDFFPASTNLKGSLDRISERASGYYILGYYPHEPQLKREFHEITVTVPGRKLKISARPGYSDVKEDKGKR